MNTLIEFIERHAPALAPVGRVAAIALLFALAWLVSRLSGRVAAYVADRSERRRAREEVADTSVIQSLKQRDTAISLIQTSVTYLAFLVAVMLSIVTLLGGRRIETVVGASFLAVVLAFAAQRFLTDVIAGLLIFFEGWFRVGDTVRIEPWGIEGIVERVSLRSTVIRGLGGERQHVQNSEVKATRVIPRGYREYELELFASDLAAAQELIEDVARIVPSGIAQFVRRPRIEETEALDEDLVRIRARAAVAAGREWLAHDLLPALLRERARDGLIIHGPMVTPIDEQAVEQLARAVWPGDGTRPTRHRARPFLPLALAQLLRRTRPR